VFLTENQIIISCGEKKLYIFTSGVEA